LLACCFVSVLTTLFVFCYFTVGEEIDEATVANETKALTENQAAAVKKRIDTLNATFRKQKRQKRTDVRSVFDLPTQVC
jgi:hypothetical protein